MKFIYPKKSVQFQNLLTPKDYDVVQMIFEHSGIQKRLEGYPNDPDFYPNYAWLNRSLPTPQSMLETIALMRGKGLRASIILPARNEAINIGRTLEQMMFFREFQLGNIAVYDNSSNDNTREIVQAMNVPLFKAEECGLEYKIPDEIHHKGTNMWFGIMNALRTEKDPTKHLVIFADTDVGLSIIELMQILRAFAEKPSLKLILPFVSRLTKKGEDNGTLTSGGRASRFTWGPMRDALLSSYLRDITEHPAQLAGIYGANLEFITHIDIPHGFGVETAIQTEAYIYAYRHRMCANDVIQFVPCGIYSQVGQSDHNIRLMAHDITHELMMRVNILKTQRIIDLFHAMDINSKSNTSVSHERLSKNICEVLGIEIPQRLPNAKHILARRKLLTDYIWTVTNEQVKGLDNQTIYRIVYYLPPAAQYLKSFLEENNDC